jgi:hypothetical protein
MEDALIQTARYVALCLSALAILGIFLDRDIDALSRRDNERTARADDARRA